MATVFSAKPAAKSNKPLPCYVAAKVAAITPARICVETATRNVEEVIRLLNVDPLHMSRTSCRLAALVEAGVLATFCSRIDPEGRSQRELLLYASAALGDIIEDLRGFSAELEAAGNAIAS